MDSSPPHDRFRPVPHRFTIEDIEVQDCSGVIFRAIDTTTGSTVAVRRFFPFGPNGGGLTADEQVEYLNALEHLETVAHPSLRNIVSGACDPVDGIPFIATEWVEGVSLRQVLAERPLNQAETIALLVHALEACEALSTVLGREGVWIETDPQTIIIGAATSHRPVTFWISPLRWLGQVSGKKGMESLVALAEAALGWSGDPPASHGTNGLAGWLEWLRHADRYTRLAEARERLAKVGGAPAPTAHRPVQSPPTTTPSGPKKLRKKSHVPAWMLGACVLIAAGLGGWVLIQKNQHRIVEESGPQTPVVSVPRYAPTRNPDLEEIHTVSRDLKPTGNLSHGGPRTAEQASRLAMESTATAEQAESDLNQRMEKIRRRGGVYLATDGDLLENQEKGSWVKIEGMLAKVHTTGTGNIYLSFSNERGKTMARAYVVSDDSGPGLNEANLKNLMGHRIQVEGVLRTMGNRAEVRIKQRSAIIEP